MDYNDDSYQRLSAELRIDRDEIDEELIAQSQHFWHVAEAHELAVAAADSKKYELETMEVEVDRDIREEMTANEDKITEKLVEAAIKRDKDYQRAALAYIQAKRNAGRWGALRESYRQRRDMLLEISRRANQRNFDEVTGRGDIGEARRRFSERRS